MPHSISEMGVLVGYKCNFRCRHCVTLRNKIQALTAGEKRRLILTINRYKPRSLLFVGGETTLYIDTINEILSGIRSLPHTRVKITTNGSFAGTIGAARKTLASFKKLNAVQLSYDRFHAVHLAAYKISNLYKACKEAGIDFSVIMTIQSPLEMTDLKELWKIGKFRIGIQKVLPVGEARRNSIEYSYPSFDDKVLRRHCPNRNKVKYLCGQGFSICCGNLAYNSKFPIIHATAAQHINSRFHRLISANNFGALLKKAGIPRESLLPRHSSECNLCEHIFGNSGFLGTR